MPKYKMYLKMARDGFYISLGSFLLGMACLTINLIKNYDTESIIVMIVGSVLFTGILLFLFLAGCIYKVNVYDDYCVYVNMVGRKKICKFNEVIISEREKSLDIADLNGKLLYRISYLFVNSDLFIKTYRIYLKANNIKISNLKNKDANIIKCNFYIRNFAVTWLIIGMFFIAGSIIMNFVQPQFILFIILLCFGIAMTLFGIALFLYYYIWRITVDRSCVCFIGFLGRKKVINISELSISYNKTGNLIYLYKNNKKFKMLNINLLHNTSALYDIHCQTK